MITYNDLVQLMKSRGYCGSKLTTYQSTWIDYKTVSNSQMHQKFKYYFNNAYKCHGIYIFADKNTHQIFYVGETHSQVLGQRLRQHFNPKDTGGLKYIYANHPNYINRINNSEILILYTSIKNVRQIKFDQDLLIGLFDPVLNRV
ncbi:MAG: hypothetical protein ACRC5M_03390 [Anaeroplasmataceae bacterium]